MPVISETTSPVIVNIAFAKKVYLIILLTVSLWCFLIIAAPLMLHIGGIFSTISTYIYVFFSRACHQIDDRCYHIAGDKLAVCSRCTFIYFSFLGGVILYPFIKKINNTRLPALWILLSAAFILLADALLDITGILKNTFFTRSVSGFLIGIVLPFYIIPGFIIFFNEVADAFKRKNYSAL